MELLLTLGRLRYADYDAWRCGERASLQPALRDDTRQIVAFLREAAEWAEALGLRPEHRDYFGWGANAGQRLAFSEESGSEADALLATHYVRPAVSADGGQLDIFLDGGMSAALNDVRAALCARDLGAAERSLALLASIAPGHRLLAAAEHLVDALANGTKSLSPGKGESELEALEQLLVPAARDVLDPAAARDVLAPVWRRLADALAEVPFDPERPALHASYAYMHCHDWCRAAAAVEAVADFAAIPPLLVRLAEARRRNGNRSGAIEVWCLLCWRFPTVAETILDNPDFADRTLRVAWSEFRDLDLDPPPETALFPAHLLLTEPGLARALACSLPDGNSGGENAFRAMRQLLRGDCVEARKAVRATGPWLLDAYLQDKKCYRVARSVGYRQSRQPGRW